MISCDLGPDHPATTARFIDPALSFCSTRLAPQLRQLLRQIDESVAQNRFHRPPLGPLGRYLSLKDDKWAVAVEHAIGRIFQEFVVHDHHDHLLLKVTALTLFVYFHSKGKQVTKSSFRETLNVLIPWLSQPGGLALYVTRPQATVYGSKDLC